MGACMHAHHPIATACGDGCSAVYSTALRASMCCDGVQDDFALFARLSSPVLVVRVWHLLRSDKRAT